ncbi:MAG: S8 family serine peptidase [Candidatus Cloacimonetes bacterium]|nr:S8 family serine peptidase [Candidatus Cloacimonadota bacterium]
MSRARFILVFIAVLTAVSLFAAPRFGERPFIDIYQVPDAAIEMGHIRIKLSEKHSALAQAYLYEDGILPGFGIEALDALNHEYAVKRITPVFGDSKQNKKWGWRHVEWGLHLWFEIQYDSRRDIRDIVMSYRALDSDLQWAEPEYKKVHTGMLNQDSTDTEYHLNTEDEPTRWTPIDPRFPEQWHYHNTGQSGGLAGSDINLLEAWDIEKGHPDVVVAVIDQGIQPNHWDMSSNIWKNTAEIPGNGIDDDGNGYIDDYYGFNFYSNNGDIFGGDHGCHVAGTIAAMTNNTSGVAGIAGGSGSGNGVKLMSCLVFTGSIQGYAAGWDVAPIYAADNGAAISQNSWIYGTVNTYDQPVLDAIDYFNANGGGNVMTGGITIFSVGNSNGNGQWYPAYYSGAFSVAATNHNDQKANYSNFDTWVDISAPGGETNIQGNQGVLSCKKDSGYGFLEGTSMACPHVSGVAALVLSYARRNNINITASQLKDILRNTADELDTHNPSYTGKLGSGRVNAHRALMAANPANPGIKITNPGNHLVIHGSQTVNVVANAWANQGSVANVKIYLDNELKATLSSAPYTWAWNTSTSSTGYHTIKAVVTDTGNRQVSQKVHVTLIHPAYEGFESGNFSQNPWRNDSTVPWTVQPSQVFTGSFAAKSGRSSTNQTSVLSLPVLVSTAGEITFSLKNSTYRGANVSNWLRFYIDGFLMDEWSGDMGWTLKSYPVNAGEHVFTWTYANYTTGVLGSECAWLDHIGLPPLATYYAPAYNLRAKGHNGYVELTWKGSDFGNPTGYRILRNGSYLQTVSGRSYTDNTVANGTIYHYSIVALYGANQSLPTRTVAVKPTAGYTADIGTGVKITENIYSPIYTNVHSLHGQAVYTKAQLNAAGVYGPALIQALGFDIHQASPIPLPNFIVRMMHTTATNAQNWHGPQGLTTVYNNTSYLPLAGGWDLLPFSTPFLWDGVNNLVVDTAWSIIPFTHLAGALKATSVTQGFHYYVNPNNPEDATNIFQWGNTMAWRPNIRLVIGPEEEEEQGLDSPQVNVIKTASGVRITWDAVQGATSYLVYRSFDPYDGFEYFGTTSSLFINDNQTLDKAFYRVKAVQE